MTLDLRYSEVLPHPLARVWAAFTSAEALGAWLMDSDFEPEVGRAFTFRCPPGPGIRGYVECRLLELEPMRRIVWSWLGTDEGEPTTVTIEFEAVPGGTRMTLRHRGAVAPDAEERTANGWAIKLRDLQAHLAEGARQRVSGNRL